MRPWSGFWISMGAWLLACAAHAAPCVTPGASCAEWLSLIKGSARILVFRTHPLHERQTDITRALVVVHGAQRDADRYFEHALASASQAGALDSSLVVAVRFASNNGENCQDRLTADELNWQCGGPGRWTAGGAAGNNARVTSFDVVDEILRQLARKETFPQLKGIVVAGHSAGGQFVARYAMANRVHDALGVGVRYVVANPSSYAYLDPARPLPVGTIASHRLATPAAFKPFAEVDRCASYDRWPYGLRHRVGYTRRLAVHELTRQLTSRPTTYLLGGQDVLPQAGFDASCPAMAQGPSRLARGLAFARYVNEQFGANHQAVVVPACGHDGRCMFANAAARELLFPAASVLAVQTPRFD